ncbi:GntR family transcriptional regulator [Roseibium marinum]|uniref:DNA-binding GntR family transcriptional regulator n=1 Tax=Roseibium marinum TaxID=281252 RepID=A0A2S3UXU2_9HYPH|nr:GntR family transcriptional regulator [Roseibium marinum]POF32269.1 DNA-binding GntR family transcriptional regulator [Roseibium marinum]
MNIHSSANKHLQTGLKTDAKRPRKSDAVYQDLKRKILTGEMTSHSPITEQSLAQDYSCSQSTIREALMQLQQYGLVIRRGYQGTYVTDPSLLEARLLLKLRIDIEATGVAEAVKRVTPGQVAELRNLDRQFEECRLRRDVFGGAELDRCLHLKLFRIAQMPILEPMLVRTTMILQRVMLSTPRPEAAWKQPSVTRHRAIFDALEAQDVHQTIDALKAHILSSAILLAPHFYGTDLVLLRDEYDNAFVRTTGLSGH